MKFKIKDLRKQETFPNNEYRYSTLKVENNEVVLERDYLGENPFHYYINISGDELIVANNIPEIKKYLESTGNQLVWEKVRAVSNNTRVIINENNFYSASPREEEILTPLYEDRDLDVDPSDLKEASKMLRSLLDISIRDRVKSIDDKNIGLLLSGGLDSMTIAFLLSKEKSKMVTAFTLKVNEDEKDIVKSRAIAKRFGLDLCEVKLTKIDNSVSITIQKYDKERKLVYEKNIAKNVDLTEVVKDALRIGGSPKKDNIYCSIAMYLISKALTFENVKTAFCGEGPNEFINDYGYVPEENGYFGKDKGNIRFRQILTFGFKKNDRQLGRGGLAKHAASRMTKIFGEFGIRLEAPYFNKEIAKVMTQIPHSNSYDKIKQDIIAETFKNEGLDDFIIGTSKEKFQDGSGVSKILKVFDQVTLIKYFEEIYGIKKTSYLTKP